MNEIDPITGLPKELETWESILKEEERIRVSVEKKRYGKIVTQIEGISKDMNIKHILKQLKTRLACGGTLKGRTIELQGDHRKKIKNVLVKLGFPIDKIELE